VTTLRSELKDHRSRSKVLAARETDARRKAQDLQTQIDCMTAGANKKPTATKGKKVAQPTAAAVPTGSAVTASDASTPSTNDIQVQAQSAALAQSEKRCKLLQGQVSSLTTELKDARSLAATASAALEALSTSSVSSAATAATQVRQAQTKLAEARKHVDELNKRIVAIEATKVAEREMEVKPKVKRTVVKKAKKKAMTAQAVDKDEDSVSEDEVLSTSTPSIDHAALFSRLQSQYEALEANYKQLQSERQADASHHAAELARLAEKSGPDASSADTAQLRLDHARQRESWEVERGNLQAAVKSTEYALARTTADHAAQTQEHERETKDLRAQLARLQQRMQQLASTPAQPNTTTVNSTSAVSATATTPSADSSVLAEQAALKKKFNTLHHQCTEAMRRLKIFELNCQCDALKDQHSKMRKAILDAFSTE
jgi:hypothetical protein